MNLSTRAGGGQAAKYHFCKDFRSTVTFTPLCIELFGGGSRYYFIHRLPCCDEILNALPNLHQHVTVILQICAPGDWTMSGHDLCLRVSLRQDSFDRTDHAIDRSAGYQIDDWINMIRENVSYDGDVCGSNISDRISVCMRRTVVLQCQPLRTLAQCRAAGVRYAWQRLRRITTVAQ